MRCTRAAAAETASDPRNAVRLGSANSAKDTQSFEEAQAGGTSDIAAGIWSNAGRSDPLDGMFERVAANPAALFTPDTLQRLAELRTKDRATFEAVREQLKRAGVRVTALDEAIAAESGSGRGPTQADLLIELSTMASLFHTPDGTGFADLYVGSHRETWAIRSKGFRRWLTHLFFEKTQGAPSSEALQSALNVIEARAHFDAPERNVYVRVGALDGRLYLDLADDLWRAVEIDAAGWRVVARPPVRFRRAAGMQPLPAPVAGGSVNALRSFLNVQTDADFVLIVAWLLAVLRNRGPYPVLVLSGEQGSAKSTFSAMLRALVDPHVCGRCRGRTAICSSPRATAMCLHSTTCPACRHGLRIHYAGLLPVADSRCGSSTPTKTRCCSMPVAR